MDASVAAGQLRTMARTWYTANETGREQGVEATVVRLRSLVSGDGALPGLIIMGTAVLLVLLIACINQANILLVNAWIRTRELSLRSALGAGRGRLVTLLMGESVILAVLGGALGLGLAWLGLRGLGTMVPQGGAGDIEPRLNGLVLSATLLLSLGASVIAGGVPALRASRTSVAQTLNEGGAATGAGRSAARLRRSLVVAEVTLSVVLLSGAALAIRTFQAQLDTETGLEPETLLVFDVRLPRARYPDRAAAGQFFDEAMLRLEAIPGVTTASAGSALPLGASRSNLHRVFLLEGAPEPPAGPDFGALWIEVDPDYLQALGIEPLRGRGFSSDDTRESTPVIMVNEAMARRMSPEEEVLGRRIRSWRDEDRLREIVAVVPDIQLRGMAGGDQPAVYVPRAQGEFTNLSLLVRTEGDPMASLPAVRAAMAEVDGDLALQGLRTLHEAHREDLAGVRTITVLFGVFGGLALTLALSGVYGVVALSVAQRNREIGIRMALGGTSRGILSGILWEGARLALVGAVLGFALSAVLSRVLSSRIVGLPGMDPGTVVGLAGLLGGAVLLASSVPALRATRVDPVRALKAD
jgi:predicted permease